MTVKVSKPAINVREELADLRKPTGIAGEAMLRAETPQEQFNLIGAGRRNLIINGAMQVAQRGTSFSPPSDGAYVVDRFHQYQAGGGVLYYEQSTDAPLGFNNSLKITVNTADSSIASGDYYFMRQNIEGFNCAQLALGNSGALTFTLSFYVKSSLTGTFSGCYQNGVANRSYVFEYNINAANTWERKTVTIVGDTTGTWSTDNTACLRVNFDLGMGSGFATTANSWKSGNHLCTSSAVKLVGTASATLYLTGVQLEAGDIATPFEHRSYGEELALCQRYYQRYGETSTSNYGPTIGYGTFNGSAGSTTTEVISVFQFPVAMRTGPDFAFSALSDFDLEPFDDPITALTTFSHSSSFFHTVSAITTARETGFVGLICMDIANGWFEFDAEL